MAQINLKIKRKMFNDAFYPLLTDYSTRWEVYRGGAGSGKSHHIMQKLILKCLNDKRKVCVCRRYGSTLDKSCWDLFLSILKDWKIFNYMKINTVNKKVTFPNDSVVYFIGLDDEQKLLSIAGITDFFIEECYEVPRDIIEQINLRLRSNAKDCQIIMAFNPISMQSWCYDFCEVNPPQSFRLHLSTYKDNKFLPQSYVDALEELITRNPNKARIFVFNEYGVDVDGLVFKNVEYVKDMDISTLLKNPNIQVRIGSDAGVIDASTIAVSLWDKENKIIYVIGEWYMRGATLDEHYQAIIDLGAEKQRIYVDSADTRLIQFLKSKGINAEPTKKGAGSVEKRIDFLLNHKIIVLTDKCPNAMVEFQNFSWIKDKVTGAFTERTTHEFSHFIDGLSYAYNDIYMAKAKAKVFDKSMINI